MKNSYFLLYANCLPVAGKKGAIICDVQRGMYFTIPIELFDVLRTNKQLRCTVEDLKHKYDNKIDAGIDAFLNYLIQKDVGMYIDDISCFPDLKETWSYPSEISNAIIEVSEYISINSFASIINELTLLGCHAIEIRVNTVFGRDNLSNLLQTMDNSSIKYAVVILPYDDSFDAEFLSELIKNIQDVGTLLCIVLMRF